MIAAQVTFDAEKVSDGNWRLRCSGPEAKIEYVTGFRDEQSIKNWLSSDHREGWLKARRYGDAK